MPTRVIVGLPRWQSGDLHIFAERLALGLSAHGHDARILLTETGSNLVSEPIADQPVPEGVVCDRLPAGADDTWGQRWEALERYLEERAPCFYLMRHDYRNNLVAPILSRRVRLIGLVHAASDLEMDQASRLGDSWDAIVAANDEIHFKIVSRLPHLAPRLVTIPHTASVGDAEATGIVQNASLADVTAEYLALLKRIEALSERRGFTRSRGRLAQTPRASERASILLPGNRDIEYVAKGDRWPDVPHVHRVGRQPITGCDSPALERHRVLIASTPGSISGVDVFAAHLVRGLREHGFDARLHGRLPPDGVMPCGFPTNLPFEERPLELDADYLGWPNRWQGMVEHLKQLAPCIYLPNYDVNFSCVAPQLPPGVHVIGIQHSDDPWHYEHLCRIGHACDALVCVSRAITDHFAELAPDFTPRLTTIPYGILLPKADSHDMAARRQRDPQAPLRIIYTGRLVHRQKRASDLIAIARELERRGIPFEMIVVGDGDLRPTMERAGHDLILGRKLWFTGAQPNESVLELLATCDAFLMPSSFDGFSVSMLEAMSRGVVPVVSDIRSGVPEAIVHGESGLVAPVGDIAAFADRLEWLWKNPADRQRLVAAAIRTVEGNFRLDQMIDRYVDLFRRIVANPLPRPCGPIAPPLHLSEEKTWALWARRVAADPAASIRRVCARFKNAKSALRPS